MNTFDLIKNVYDFNKSVNLPDERHQKQAEINEELRSTTDRLRNALAELTTRVAVLEARNDAVDDKVHRVMTEVIADWERQHAARETERLRAELAEAKRSRAIGE